MCEEGVSDLQSAAIGQEFSLIGYLPSLAEVSLLRDMGLVEGSRFTVCHCAPAHHGGMVVRVGRRMIGLGRHAKQSLLVASIA